MNGYCTRANALGTLYGAIALGLHIWSRYTSWWWYDNLAHFAAGLSLGSLIATDESATGQDLVAVAGLTFAWEVAEYATGTYPWDGTLPQRAAAEETILDSLLVGIGAWLASRWAKR